MKTLIEIEPQKNEKPSAFADRLGTDYAKKSDKKSKKEKGQFFTPVEIADYMSSLSNKNQSVIRILDPGAGAGVLSCSLIEYLISTNSNIKEIHLTAYENDLELLNILTHTYEYLKKWVKFKTEIEININIVNEDFILDNSDVLLESSLFSTERNNFDIIISNPPYFKISINDKRALAARNVINGHPNVYSIFMAIAANLLNDKGELITISPRSFASGSYFKVFRKHFFNLIDPEYIHLFDSRKDAFNKDKVLQETLILKGIRKNGGISANSVKISASAGINDLKNYNIKTFKQDEIINFSIGSNILFLPVNDTDIEILNTFKTWDNKLEDFGIKISTGPVVAFRAKEYIFEDNNEPNLLTAPLFWLHNINQMKINHPVFKKNKGQFIQISSKSKYLLISNNNYILLRRFSSKDDKSRLIASPYLKDDFDSPYIGVENKVNYIYRPNGFIEIDELYGLAILLNSKLFDSYFRIFNGNVNVSASEIKEMPVPPLDIIKKIGREMLISNDTSVSQVNKIVNSFIYPAIEYEEN